MLICIIKLRIYNFLQNLYWLSNKLKKCVRIRLCSNSIKYASNALELIYVTQVYYRTSHIENSVHKANENGFFCVYRDTQKNFNALWSINKNI